MAQSRIPIGTLHKTGYLATSLIILLIGLVSCSSAPQQDYSDVRARLNPQAGEIVLPLEAYAMTSAEVQEVAHANALLVDNCLAEGGRSHPRANQDWGTIPTLPDRRYGLWSQSDAEANGYELPESPTSDELASQEDALGDEWWDAFGDCRSDLDLFPVMGINTSAEMSPVDQGMRESFDALIASSELAASREEWTNCIVAEGLTPNPDAKVLVPSFPPPGEEQLRAAAIDVGCKQSLNSIQPLADFEARQQMAYIEQHESDLTAYRDQVDQALKAAREVLATYGG